MNHKGQDVIIQYGKYSDGSKAISLICDSGEDAGAPYAIATIYYPELNLEKDEVVIKSYAENEGILEMLEAEGVLKRTDRIVLSGCTRNFICKLASK